MNNLMTIGGQQAVISFYPDINMFRGEFVGLANGGADFYAADIHTRRAQGAFAASTAAARVCQPLPLARQRANASGAMRSVTGSLCTASGGRPLVRRAISSPVVTRPSPAKACCSPRSSEAMNSSVSVSGFLDIVFLLQSPQKIGWQVVKFGLGVGNNQQDLAPTVTHKFATLRVERLRSPDYASLHPGATHATLAQTERH